MASLDVCADLVLIAWSWRAANLISCLTAFKLWRYYCGSRFFFPAVFFVDLLLKILESFVNACSLSLARLEDVDLACFCSSLL